VKTTTPHLRVRSAAWILAFALAFGGFAEAGPAVLCIGDDGHTDVEYSLASCCVPVADAREQKVLLSANSGGPGCDDCVDLGLDQNVLKAGKRLLPAPEATLLRFDLSKSRAGATMASAAAPRSAHESVTSELSSIVLLI
jgi:hypothetical protein